jgi:hypothetical protein
MSVALFPAGLGLILTSYILGFLLSPTQAIPFAALVATAILLAEVYVAIRLLGKAFEHFDLSSETTN